MYIYIYVSIYAHIQLILTSPKEPLGWISICPSRCPLRHLGRSGHGAHVDAPGTAAARRGGVAGGSAAGLQRWATHDALASRMGDCSIDTYLRVYMHYDYI